MSKPQSEAITADLGTADVSQAAPASVKKKARRRFSLRLNHPVHGKMELNLTDNPVLRSSMLIVMGDMSAPTWQQIAKVGVFRGHYAGDFELNPKVFDEIVRNYNDVDLGNVALDREHCSEQDPAQGSIPVTGAPAQGWIKRLDNRGQAGLWGLVEWQPEAAADIKAGRYKFLSPAIRFGSRHPETGKPIGARLTSVAMTNRPFLRGMQPLMASNSEGSGMRATCYSSNEFMPRLRACLGLGPLASAADCGDTLDTLATYLEAAGGDASATVHGVPLQNHLHPLRELVSAQPAHTWQQVFEIVQAMIDAAIAEHVADYHEDETDEEEPASMRDGSQGVATMADTVTDTKPAPVVAPPPAEDFRALRDEAVALATDATTKLSQAEGKVAELTFSLRERDVKLSALETELTALREERNVRLASDRSREVDEAIAVHGKKKGISPADKDDLLAFLCANEAAFRRQYPPIPAGERHLLADISGQRAPDAKASEAAPTQPEPAVAPEGAALTLSDIITHYMAEHPGVSRQQALKTITGKRGA
jgi:Mu-like prophage I protein